MEYRKAKKLERGDVVLPCKKDINGEEVLPHGDYLVERIDNVGKDIIITLDNGQQVNHKGCAHPPCIQSFGRQFYCSWFGMTDNIENTGLSYRQILRCGIVPRDLYDDYNNLSREEFNKKYL